jgi:hypothetical protein
VKSYYFGAVGRAGHYFWDTDLRSHSYDVAKIVPWGFNVDSDEFLPKYTTVRDRGSFVVAPEGTTRLHHENGWSALAIVDRGVDSRPGSKSIFMFEKPDLTAEECWRLAQEIFPTITRRFSFEVLLGGVQ